MMDGLTTKPFHFAVFSHLPPPPARVAPPFLKVMDCADSGCDKVSLRCTCTLSFCSASDVALRLRLEKVKNESAFLCSALGVTPTEEASLQALACVACILPALSQKKSFKAAHLNLALDAPCWLSVCTCPSKAVAIQSTLVSNFFIFQPETCKQTSILW